MIPQEFKEHLKHREGFRDEVYLDTLDKPTCGVGHLLSPAENEQYNIGDTVPQDILDEWLLQDSNKAWQAATAQIEEIGITNTEFTLALAAVNFQLGTRWTNKFPSAYQALKDKDYNEAIKQVSTGSGTDGQSKWKEQTPVRVKDFVDAIQALTNH